ncbi:MAG: Crp/Fnr family transcriptional regulator [Nitrospirae bacterium]|nr:Crp/Fnr family transcriptional regulator [Nitrospirota bacterium]
MWFNAFTTLRTLNDAEWKAALAQVREITLPPGAAIFQCGDPCRNYLFVVSGSVTVTSLSHEGREVVLYRVGSGQTCTLTTACLLGETDYPAQGIAEGEVRAAVMPRDVFNRLLADSVGFRRFVFAQIGDRMAGLMRRVQELAFERTHVRLARKLLEGRDGDDTVHATHAQLAVELGTVREVVSRLLKEYERNGWVRLFRGGVHIVDAESLARHQAAM